MKMNVFLTGNVQVGKSTAIKRFLEKENISPLGFTTHLDRSTGLLTIKIIGKDGDREIKAAAPIGGSRPVPDIEAFDRAGKMLTDMDTSDCDMLIMDELGFMERDAHVFTDAVPVMLDRGIRTVGVLRNKPDGPFWDMLHERDDTVIITVNEENRDDIPDIISRYIK